MPRTSTTHAGENTPKYGSADVTQTAGTYQPSRVVRIRNFTGWFVRMYKNTIATSAALTAEIRTIVAVGSPGNSGTAPPPHRPITAPIRQNRRVRTISSRSSASRGEVIVVEPAPDVGELGSRPEAAGA